MTPPPPPAVPSPSRGGSERAPAGEIADEVAERAAGGAGQLVGVEDAGGGEGERDLLGAGELVKLGDRLVAEAALGGVDDPFEGEVVGGLGDDAQVSERVADLGALVEAEAADDPVGQADGDEAVLELAGLELGADEDGGVVEAAAAMLERLHFLADAAGLLRPVPDADHLDLGPSPPSSSLTSVHSVLPRRPALWAITPEAAARMCGVER